MTLWVELTPAGELLDANGTVVARSIAGEPNVVVEIIPESLDLANWLDVSPHDMPVNTKQDAGPANS